jgi:glycosyltransferase involved in cell wall biosynthesis
VKILIAAAQFSSNISGLQRHAFNVVRCLLKQPDVSEVHFLCAPWQYQLVQLTDLDSMDRVIIHVAKMDQGLLSRNLWHYYRLPKLVAQIQPDVVHLSYPVPIDAVAISCPVVLTLHDLYPYEIPGNFGFPRVIFNRAILQQCLRSVDAIACVSDTTLLRMKQYAPREIWEKALRIYNCVEAEAECAEHSPLPNWNGEPFLLSVSQHRKNKNIPLLIRVLHRLLDERRVHTDMRLVVIGITGPETTGIYKLVSELRLDKRVIFVQGLSEPSLQWCYRHCEALVAPSITEGFGLPVAEALLAGCRAVCSDIPAFREIDETHCRFVALGTDAEARFADAIVATLKQYPTPPLSLPQFSSEVLGTQYMNVYRGLLPTASCLPAAQYAGSAQITNAQKAVAMTETNKPFPERRRDERDYI